MTVYDQYKMIINNIRNTIPYFLLLCTKHTYLTFDGDMFIQVDGVTMGSPFGTPTLLYKL